MYVLCKGAPWVSNLSKLQETSQTYFSCVYSTITLLNPVVQKADNTIHWINLFPVDNTIGFPNTGTSRCTYPLELLKPFRRQYVTYQVVPNNRYFGGFEFDLHKALDFAFRLRNEKKYFFFFQDLHQDPFLTPTMNLSIFIK